MIKFDGCLVIACRNSLCDEKGKCQAQEVKMQMVNCEKCNEPIDHRHFFGLTPTGAVHVACDDPFGDHQGRDAYKVLPDFTWKLKGQGRS